MDDYYAVAESRRAVDDFRLWHNIEEPLNNSPGGGVWWRVEKKVVINWDFYEIMEKDRLPSNIIWKSFDFRFAETSEDSVLIELNKFWTVLLSAGDTIENATLMVCDDIVAYHSGRALAKNVGHLNSSELCFNKLIPLVKPSYEKTLVDYIGDAL